MKYSEEDCVLSLCGIILTPNMNQRKISFNLFFQPLDLYINERACLTFLVTNKYKEIIDLNETLSWLNWKESAHFTLAYLLAYITYAFTHLIYKYFTKQGLWDVFGFWFVFEWCEPPQQGVFGIHLF